MTISTTRVSVGTAATSLGVSFQMEHTVLIQNLDNTDTVYLGNADVTTANGFALNKSELITITLPASDNLFAVSGKTGHVVAVLQPKPNA